jgi:hypothetical protein
MLARMYVYNNKSKSMSIEEITIDTDNDEQLRKQSLAEIYVSFAAKLLHFISSPLYLVFLMLFHL